MKTETLTRLLQFAGVLHLGLIAAGLLMPRAVDLKRHLATLPPFPRQLFWTYYGFIALCLLGFGGLTVILAPQLAQGGSVSASLCLFLAIFWTFRLVAATFILDVTPYLKSRWHHIGYQCTNIVFIFLPLIYLLAAWKGFSK